MSEWKISVNKEDVVNKWYYIAYNDMLKDKITNELWEEIKYTIQEWKKAHKKHD